VRAILLAAISLLTVTLPAPAQTWRELYDRGEYEKAAELLHPEVIEAQTLDVPFPDLDAAEALGRLYRDGRGVPKDTVFACSLFTLAHHSDNDWRTVARLERLRDDVCGSLSAEARHEALEMMTCPKFGVDLQGYSLDAEHWVEVSRLGIRVRFKAREHIERFPNSCDQVIPVVRYTRVEPLADSAARGPRHFLEIFSWTGSAKGGQRRQTLSWYLVEILGTSADARAAEMLREEAGSRWPHPRVPAEFVNVSLHMAPDGAVHWRFDGSTRAGVVERLPVEVAETPDEFPPVPPGNSRIEVRVADRFGAPILDATVTLSGLVSRDLRTDASGGITFEGLPEGRYDVVASSEGLAPSLPHVVDVSESAVRPLQIVLKPPAPTQSVSFSCGSAAPRTLDGLAAEADAIVHVQIERQHSYRWASALEPERLHILTNFEARWIRSFRANSRVAPGDEIVQGGGRIDDGEQIESSVAHPHAPLNVGDEYVLFLKRHERGSVRLHYGPEGAFRLRNGRVEPLGEQDVARAWKGRSAAKFLEALRTKINH
jgi:hypothetical protein